jgi:hypothetical protein
MTITCRAFDPGRPGWVVRIEVPGEMGIIDSSDR